VNIAVDDLQIGHPPEIEECRPWKAPVLAPYTEERHPMIDFRSLPKASACFGTSPILQTLEQSNLVTGSSP